jgi:hypothetical protein
VAVDLQSHGRAGMAEDELRIPRGDAELLQQGRGTDAPTSGSAPAGLTIYVLPWFSS